jgi:hypothetical protein
VFAPTMTCSDRSPTTGDHHYLQASVSVTALTQQPKQADRDLDPRPLSPTIPMGNPQRGEGQKPLAPLPVESPGPASPANSQQGAAKRGNSTTKPTDDGGEAILSGQPRETGGERPVDPDQA